MISHLGMAAFSIVARSDRSWGWEDGRRGWFCDVKIDVMYRRIGSYRSVSEEF
jgi:hypothetical protein